MAGNNYKKKEKKARATDNGFSRFLSAMLDGSLFLGRTNMPAMRFILFLSALALFLIFNTYYAERKTREVEHLRNEMTELRVKYIQGRSDYMHLTKQSEMARRLRAEGFTEPTEPPRQLLPEEEKKLWDRLPGWRR